MYITITLALLALTTTESINTKLFSGIHIQEYKQTFLPYKTSIPLTYHLPINFNLSVPKPPANLTFCSSESTNITYCNVEENLRLIRNLIIDQLSLEKFNFNLHTVRSRTPKGIAFISHFLDFCCDVATKTQFEGILDNQIDLTKHYNDIVRTVKTEYQDLVINTKKMANFSNNVVKYAQHLESNIQTLQKEISILHNNSAMNMLDYIYYNLVQVWMYTYQNFYFDNLRSVKNSCLKNNIPTSLVNESTLAQDLLSLNIAASKNNLTLAIDHINLLQLYFTLPISKCIISPNQIIITISVPLRPLHQTYTIYHMKPIPLTWENKTCYIAEKDSILIKSDRSTIIINQDQIGCNQITFPLCHLPRIINLADDTAHCLHHAITGTNVKNLKRFCPFTCHPRTEHPIITQIKPNKFIISNIKYDLIISCKYDSKSNNIIPNQTIGTIEILLPCQCLSSSKDTTIIDYLEPCDINDHPDFAISHLLPASWTNLNNLQLLPIDYNHDHSFDNITDIVNYNWTLSSPTYYVHNLERQDTLEPIKPKHTFSDIFNDSMLWTYILIIWTTILTLLSLITIYCLHVMYIKLNCLQPQPPHRDFDPAPPRRADSHNLSG